MSMRLFHARARTRACVRAGVLLAVPVCAGAAACLLALTQRAKGQLPRTHFHCLCTRSAFVTSTVSRGLVVLRPVSSGHRFWLSMGGSPAHGQRTGSTRTARGQHTSWPCGPQVRWAGPRKPRPVLFSERKRKSSQAGWG